ncbi:MAG: hypothetical protein ACKVWV_09740 [Planctomycetota bacterium]
MPQIPLEDAVRRANEFVTEIYANEPISNLLLEEIRLSHDDKHWLMTIGFDVPGRRSPIFHADGHAAPRNYKTIRIDATSGIVDEMTIRESEE